MDPEVVNGVAESAQLAKNFTEQALVYAAAFCSIGFAAMGSAYGCGVAACSAIGAWKKCYAQNKPAPFQLVILSGVPLSQTIYGMIIMFIVMNGKLDTHGIWYVYMAVGILSGIAMGVSALWQGKAAAAACDAYAETRKGFANQLMVLGIVETIAIFAMVFAIVLLFSANTKV